MGRQKNMILIVEDEPSLRDLYEDIYQNILGDEYEIKVEVNCEEASRAFGTNKDRIILIHCDFNLTRADGIMHGIEFLEYVRERGYKGIAILASGNTFEGDLLEIILSNGIFHLMKPISMIDLLPFSRMIKEAR